ncbi:MAG: IS110 family transposase, partial [Thermomicrobiales bacterium]
MISGPRPYPAVVGIDVGERVCHIALQREPGNTIEHLAAPRAEIAARILELLANGPPATIAIELTGKRAHPIIAGLEGSPHTLMIAQHTDEAALRQMLRSKRKTDKTDAMLICKLVRWHVTPELREATAPYLTPWAAMRAAVTTRDAARFYQALVRDRIRLLNRTGTATHPTQIAMLDAQVKLLDAQIASTIAAMIETPSPDVALLATIPGITPRRACIFAAAIGDIQRFQDTVRDDGHVIKGPDRLASYLCVRPSYRPQSGESKGKKFIPRNFDMLHTELHMLGLQVARYPDRTGSLGQVYTRAKQRTGDGRKAMGKVKSHTIHLMHAILTTGEPYRDPQA